VIVCLVSPEVRRDEQNVLNSVQCPAEVESVGHSCPAVHRYT
jgi:hypothetical protein